jgi:hypothetical protein
VPSSELANRTGAMAVDAVVQMALDVESTLASAKIDRTSVVATCKILQDPDSPGVPQCDNAVHGSMLVSLTYVGLATVVILGQAIMTRGIQCCMPAARDRRVGRVCAKLSGNLHDAV